MLTEEDARRLVLAEIARVRDGIEYELGIHRVRQISFGWLFFWGAVGDGWSGQRPRLGGNGPLLLDRENGRLIRTATSVPVARQIADYERRLRHEAHRRNAAAKRSAPQPGIEASVRSRPSEFDARDRVREGVQEAVDVRGDGAGREEEAEEDRDDRGAGLEVASADEHHEDDRQQNHY